jgi:predicted TIM-barrel fold metal-dependent hydrolase
LETIEMFRTYKNVYGDTAFMPEESVYAVVKAGFADRILLGSDFPITHYFAQRNKEDNETNIILEQQYKKDIAVLQKYENILKGKAV